MKFQIDALRTIRDSKIRQLSRSGRDQDVVRAIGAINGRIIEDPRLVRP